MLVVYLAALLIMLSHFTDTCCPCWSTMILANESALMRDWPMLQVLRKEQAMSEDSAFLKEQMEALLKVSST